MTKCPLKQCNCTTKLRIICCSLHPVLLSAKGTNLATCLWQALGAAIPCLHAHMLHVLARPGLKVTSDCTKRRQLSMHYIPYLCEQYQAPGHSHLRQYVSLRLAAAAAAARLTLATRMLAANCCFICMVFTQVEIEYDAAPASVQLRHLSVAPSSKQGTQLAPA